MHSYPQGRVIVTSASLADVHGWPGGQSPSSSSDPPPGSKPVFAWLSDLEVPRNASIFLLESNPEVETINPISQCAVESAALRNPGRNVYFVTDRESKIQVGIFY